MISIEELLTPISPDKPCGDDCSLSPDFLQLETLLRSKQETMLAKEADKAEEPNWSEIEEVCLRLLSYSKHLHVAVVLSLAWLQSRGLPGFHAGTTLLRGLLEHYWEPVYPLLDPEDSNDPTERLNIISALTRPAGTLGDSLKFIVRLRQAPVVYARDQAITTSDIIKAESNTPNARSLADTKNAISAANPAQTQAIFEALDGILDDVREIEAALGRVTEPQFHQSWKYLSDTLEDIKRRLSRYATQAASPAPAHEKATAMSQPSEERTSGGISAANGIDTREDVIRALDLICGYYSRHEPSSPIPLLLQRAQRLVNKDFMEIIKDLSPDSLKPLKVIVGETTKDAG